MKNTHPKGESLMITSCPIQVSMMISVHPKKSKPPSKPWNSEKNEEPEWKTLWPENSGSTISGKKMLNISVETLTFQKTTIKKTVSTNKVVQDEISSTVTLMRLIHTLEKEAEKKDRG